MIDQRNYDALAKKLIEALETLLELRPKSFCKGGHLLIDGEHADARLTYEKERLGKTE